MFSCANHICRKILIHKLLGKILLFNKIATGFLWSSISLNIIFCFFSWSYLSRRGRMQDSWLDVSKDVQLCPNLSRFTWDSFRWSLGHSWVKDDWECKLRYKFAKVFFHQFNTNNFKLLTKICMQSWAANTRHGVTRKINPKNLKHTGLNLFKKNLQLQGCC